MQVKDSKKAAKTDDELRLTKARADKAELEVLQKKGAVIGVEEIERLWSSLIIAFRNRLLTLPSALAKTLADMQSPGEIELTLKKEITDALQELSEMRSKTKTRSKTKKDDGNE